MATPRSKLIDKQLALHYHLISRCVRRSWLCGRDRYSGKKYDHRKAWLTSRLFHLAKYFAVEIEAYVIMSNHFHLVVFHDPLACETWSDVDVAYRWTQAFPPRLPGNSLQELEERRQLQQEQLLESPEELDSARRTLGSLSDFMKHLKQPIAYRANREDKCTGHFFEGRFYSGALLGEAAVLATMAYVDLNPVRARIAASIDQCVDSSIRIRLRAIENTPERLRQALAPLVSGLDNSSSRLTMTLTQYIEHLTLLTSRTKGNQSDEQNLWFIRVSALKKRQRAYGFDHELKDWAMRHGYKRMDAALPN